MDTVRLVGVFGIWDSQNYIAFTVTALNVFSGCETFYVKMDKSGRITVPKLILKLLLRTAANQQRLTGATKRMQLEPA